SSGRRGRAACDNLVAKITNFQSRRNAAVRSIRLSNTRSLWTIRDSIQSGDDDMKGFSSRRLVLLASAAGLAISAGAAGASGFNGSNLPAFTTLARADSVQPSAGFADVVAKVKPAVISVRVKIDETARTTGMGDNDESEANPGSPFEKFFDQFGRQGMQQGMPQTRPRGRQVTGEGSGFFISADGYAVTNNHVVDGAKTVQVTTDEGAVYKAQGVGTDARPDLSLITVE